MKKFLLVVFFFYLGFVLFMPKINLYYTLENFAKKERIEIKEGSLKDRWFDLDIKNASVYYDGVNSLEAESANIAAWLFYNKVSMTNVRPSAAIKNMLNVNAETVTLRHSVLDYKNVLIEAIGDFGAINGSLDLMERKVKFILEPSAKFKNNKILKQYFKKQEEGFVYESKF